MAATDPVRNFAKVAVSGGYSATDTSILLSSSDPNIGNIPDPNIYGDYNLVWWNNTQYADPADDPNKEIVRATAKTSYTLIIERAQEGTTATAKNTAGCTYKVVMAPTRKFRDDLETAIVEYGPEYGSVIEYGAVGDGSTDDYTAINAAKTALHHIVFPEGTYRIGTSITFSVTYTLEFLQGAMIEPDAGVTVTIEGQIIAGNNQIFTGSGTVTANARHCAEFSRWWGLTTDDDFISRGALKATTGLRDGLSWISGANVRSKTALLSHGCGQGIAGSSPSIASFRKQTFSALTISGIWPTAYDGSFVTGFDGRYVYIAENGGTDTTCHVGRFDTTQSFAATAPPWEVIDIQDYLSDVFYITGTAFDGRYLYFLADSVANGTLDNLVRYDTTLPFADADSWQVKDLTAVDSIANGYWKLLFDGRYVYAIPYSVVGTERKFIRYDTSLQFSENASYEVMNLYAISTDYVRYFGGCFDGRYCYFTPNRTTGSYNYVARYDTTASFTSSGSWSFFDLDSLIGSVRIPCEAAICDGRYVYFPPKYIASNADGDMPRYDTTMDFTSASAWTTFPTKDITSTFTGSYGTAFMDGRNLFLLGSDLLLQYDTWKPYGQAASWLHCHPATLYGGTEALTPTDCASDGSHVYMMHYGDYFFWRMKIHPESGFMHRPSGTRQQVDGWYQDDVSASQTGVVLSRLSGACTNAWIPTVPGSITRVCVYSNAARSAGTLTVEVCVNGTGTGLTAVLNGTDTTFATGTQTADKDAFVAGDRLDIRITTDGSWAPTTADIRASLEVEL